MSHVKRYKLPLNTPLYRVLSSSRASPISDPCSSYRIGEILYSLFRYIGLNKLYVSQTVVACNGDLQAALGVKTFLIDECFALIIPKIIEVTCYSITGSGLEKFLNQWDMNLVETIIRQNNTLEDVAGSN